MTAQASEIIEYRGQQYSLIPFPLYALLETRKDISFGMYTTAHWRGYQGYWKLENDRLYLTAIESANHTLSDLFNTNEPVFADWYSGALKIGFGESYFDDWDTYYENYLWVKIENGVAKERKIIKEIQESSKLEFGKYNGRWISDVLKGKVNQSPKSFGKHFIADIILFMTKKDFNKKVITPYFNITEDAKVLVEKMRKSDIKYLLTDDFLAFDRDFFIWVSPAKDEGEQFSLFLEGVLSSSFTTTYTLSRNDLPTAEISENTFLLNPDVSYIEWAIKEIEGFCIYPHTLKEIKTLKYLKHFNIKRLNSMVFEYTPVFEERDFKFNPEIEHLNLDKFQKKHGVNYDPMNEIYIQKLPNDELYNKFGFYLDENYLPEESDEVNVYEYDGDDNDHYDYERDYFDAMTDGQLGDYDDYIERGGNIDDIDTWARG